MKTLNYLTVLLKTFFAVIFPRSMDYAPAICTALRDLYSNMDKGKTVPPILFLEVLHMAFPRFAEKNEHGGYAQQDANECWMELIRMLQQKLPSKASETEQKEKFK